MVRDRRRARVIRRGLRTVEEMRMTRTTFLGAATGMLGAIAAACGLSNTVRAASNSSEHFEVEHTEAEWRKLLTPYQFAILRQEGTEPAWSSPLESEKRAGVYACAGCDLPLFSSKTKFDSGTGWPSFYQPLPNAVAKREDHTFLMDRTEVHCRRCGGHLGHVFDDGPPPTGLRYCMNGLAMVFHPKA